MPLGAVSISLRDAHTFVGMHHRHSKPLPEWQSRMQDIAAVGAVDDDGNIIGVVILARPASAGIPEQVAEVSRLCTLGVHNAGSFLYSRAARAASALGYERIITYIRADDETGTSLRAAGWSQGPRADRRGTRPHRVAVAPGDGVVKQRWEKVLRDPRVALALPVPDDAVAGTLFDGMA